MTRYRIDSHRNSMPYPRTTHRIDAVSAERVLEALTIAHRGKQVDICPICAVVTIDNGGGDTNGENP